MRIRLTIDVFSPEGAVLAEELEEYVDDMADPRGQRPARRQSRPCPGGQGLAGRRRRTVGADGSVPPAGNTVDLETATYENSIGAPELATVWEDPDFNPDESAFYYVRVLEIPTPRHSTYDAVAIGVDPTGYDRDPTIQERAYSSPIWYTP
jgi:hypothetical protein